MSKLTSGCRPREVCHASLKTLPHLQAAAVAVCRFSQSRLIKQASLIRWLRQQSRPRGGRHASSMARCALSLRLSPYVPKNRTPPVSKLTSGCRPREVRHASSMARCALSLRLSPYVDSAKAASSSELDSVAPAESTHGS